MLQLVVQAAEGFVDLSLTDRRDQAIALCVMVCAAQIPFAVNIFESHTDPYDGDYSDPVAEILHEKKASDSLGGIQFMNGKCGFPDSVYKRMMSTSALMGQQSEENKKFRVSWTYHPDRGLEVLYEKK